MVNSFCANNYGRAALSRLVTHLSQSVVTHHADEYGEGLEFGHMQQEEANNERATLTIADLSVVQRICLHDIK